MIADAVDTAVTLGWALAAWIVLTAAVGTLALWTVTVTVCWTVRSAWRAVQWAAEVAAAPRRPLGARVTAELPASDSSPARAADGRSDPRLRPVPAWAQPEEEAA